MICDERLRYHNVNYECKITLAVKNHRDQMIRDERLNAFVNYEVKIIIVINYHRDQMIFDPGPDLTTLLDK